MPIYRVEEENAGRAGMLCYFEDEKSLKFYWEMAGYYGYDVSVATAEEWDVFCERQAAEWAKGRRAEIIQHLIECLQQKRPATTCTIIETGLEVHF